MIGVKRKLENPENNYPREKRARTTVIQNSFSSNLIMDIMNKLNYLKDEVDKITEKVNQLDERISVIENKIKEAEEPKFSGPPSYIY